jgi:putative transposase
MPKESTPTFVHEMPLRTGRSQAHTMAKRFDVAHFPYNAVLQQMLERLDAMRADPRFDVARKMPKRESSERNAAFALLRKEYGFSEYAAHDVVAKHIRASHYLDELIDSHTA